MSDLRERHAGEHECMGSVGKAIYDPGTPCDAIRGLDEGAAAERERLRMIADESAWTLEWVRDVFLADPEAPTE